MLVEMGFSRIDALEALRASNNDINMATNFLLQHWEGEISVRRTTWMRKAAREATKAEVQKSKAEAVNGGVETRREAHEILYR